MTQKQKQLLLKDLCARLPYGVKILDVPADVIGRLFLISTTDTVQYDPVDETNDDNWNQTLYNIKPYLRPMSSMTKEEENECIGFSRTIIIPHVRNWFGFSITNPVFTDWLNAHHFDYRGLIPMGLALEAPENMYKNE